MSIMSDDKDAVEGGAQALLCGNHKGQGKTDFDHGKTAYDER